MIRQSIVAENIMKQICSSHSGQEAETKGQQTKCMLQGTLPMPPLIVYSAINSSIDQFIHKIIALKI
jgi:hypothetical protein